MLKRKKKENDDRYMFKYKNNFLNVEIKKMEEGKMRKIKIKIDNESIYIYI